MFKHSGPVFLERTHRAVWLCLLSLLAPPALAQADGDAIAIVNGRPLARREVVDLLMESHGLAAMQQLIMLDLARQETRRLGLEVAPADVRAEYDYSVEQLAQQANPDGTPMSEDQKRRTLDALLEQKGLSMAEFMVGMERNAHLRKAVRRDVKVDERLVREQFARIYGEKVEVRHIQLADMNQIAEAQALLKDGQDFAEVARRMSVNRETASRGGDLGQFTISAENIPPALREAAFSLAPGEVSAPIRVDAFFHILRLERRIAPPEVPYEKVRDQVEASLRAKMEASEMSHLATELFRKARINVLQPKLRAEFEKLLSESGTPGGVGP
jgi:parvulin-like peptidyl-prolyl isomerase